MYAQTTSNIKTTTSVLIFLSLYLTLLYGCTNILVFIWDVLVGYCCRMFLCSNVRCRSLSDVVVCCLMLVHNGVLFDIVAQQCVVWNCCTTVCCLKLLHNSVMSKIVAQQCVVWYCCTTISNEFVVSPYMNIHIWAAHEVENRTQNATNSSNPRYWVVVAQYYTSGIPLYWHYWYRYASLHTLQI